MKTNSTARNDIHELEQGSHDGLPEWVTKRFPGHIRRLGKELRRQEYDLRERYTDFFSTFECDPDAKVCIIPASYAYSI